MINLVNIINSWDWAELNWRKRENSNWSKGRRKGDKLHATGLPKYTTDEETCLGVFHWMILKKSSGKSIPSHPIDLPV